MQHSQSWKSTRRLSLIKPFDRSQQKGPGPVQVLMLCNFHVYSDIWIAGSHFKHTFTIVTSKMVCCKTKSVSWHQFTGLAPPGLFSHRCYQLFGLIRLCEAGGLTHPSIALLSFNLNRGLITQNNSTWLTNQDIVLIN